MHRQLRVLLAIPLLATAAIVVFFLALSGGSVQRLLAIDNTQQFRDVGAVRVWADTIVQQAGVFTATGNVNLGPANRLDRWYSISQNTVWISTTRKMTLTGVLAIAGSNQLLSGKFPVNGLTGALFIPSNGVKLYTRLGSSNIAITPTFSINIASPEIDVSAKVSLTLPEGKLEPNILFKLGQGGRITGTAQVPISLKLAGGTLTSNVSVTQDGLSALLSTYKLDDITITLRELKIDGKGEFKLKFGVGVDFPIDDFSVDSDFFKLTNVRGQLGVKLATGQPPKFEIGLTGKVKLDKLPENSSVTANGVSLKFSDGALVGGIGSFKITVSGHNMNLGGAQFAYPILNVQAADGTAATARKRVLLVDTADYELPRDFRPVDEITPTVHLRNVFLQPTAPYITLQGAGITLAIGKEYYLGGDANSTNSVKLSGIVGRINYDFTNNGWSTSITATLGIKLGDGVATAVTGNFRANGFGVNVGKYSARIANITLDVAGAQLAINQMDFANGAFTAGSATLRLPQNLGSVTVNNIRIDQNGLRLSNGAFTLPDIAYSAMKLTQNSGAFAVSGLRYTIDITSTVRIEGGATPLPGSGGNTGVLVRGKLHVRNGRVTGELDQFGFTLSGAEFRLTNPRFLDNRIIADQASVGIPTGGGTVTASANGIEIGGSAGFKFRQPTIQMTDFVIAGVGIRNPHLKFTRGSGGNFAVTGGAQLQFTQFSVAGEFTIVKRNSFVEFNPVILDFTATPGIPLGQSGFELTRIRGQFNLTRDTAVIEIGVRIESQTKVVIPIVAMDGTIRLQVVPRFDLRAKAGVQVVGITVSTVDLHFTPTAATLTGTLEYQVARQIVNLSFGMDSQRQFTMFGSMRGELGLKKGSLINWCVPFVPCVTVPPFDFTLASVTYDAGKFQDRRSSTVRTVWGGRTQFTVFGNRAYAFLRLAPSPQKIFVGTDLDDYRAVRPTTAAAGVTAVDAPDYIDAGGSHTFQITRSAELLVFAEVITPTNMGLPPQPLQVTSPKGEQFTLQPFFTAESKTWHLYSLAYVTPPDAVGTWSVLSTPGNAVKMWGQRPGVQISQFSVRKPDNTAIPVAGSSAPVQVNNGDLLQLDFELKKPEPGMQVQFFAESPDGVRNSIIDLSDESATTLPIHQSWPVNLPAGVYTLTLIADDFGNSLAISSTVAVQVIDNTAPAAVSNLGALVQVDGSVKLTWDANTAPDRKGYRIGVAGETPVDIDGEYSSYVVAGLPPGSNQTISIQVYDSSDNLSAADSVNVTLPLFRLESVTPFAGETTGGVTQVAAAFNEAVTSATLTLTDSEGQPVLAASTPISVERDVAQVEIFGAQLLLGGALPPGQYTAVIDAQQTNGQPVTWQWSFVATAAEQTVFLPLITR